MKDETYSFISDVKDRGSTARSARNRRTHNGKGGKVRLPSDNLSKKELMKMNGEVKSYRLNDPIKWDEFKAMPDDIKATYIKLLRQKFNVPDCKIGEMMGVNKAKMSIEIKRIGLGHGVKHGGNKGWDKEGFYAWANGVDKLPTPVEEEPIQGAEPIQEEPETFVEDDLPFDIPEADIESKPYFQPVPYTAVPCSGSMTFRCHANLALNTLRDMLANEMVDLHVSWGVIEERGAVNDQG